jgi:hypothetical protein
VTRGIVFADIGLDFDDASRRCAFVGAMNQELADEILRDGQRGSGIKVALGQREFSSWFFVPGSWFFVPGSWFFVLRSSFFVLRSSFFVLRSSFFVPSSC